MLPMDNKAIAGILYETADLQDSFRVRSYRNAAQVIEALPQQIANPTGDPKNLLEVPSIGEECSLICSMFSKRESSKSTPSC